MCKYLLQCISLYCSIDHSTVIEITLLYLGTNRINHMALRESNPKLFLCLALSIEVCHFLPLLYVFLSLYCTRTFTVIVLLWYMYSAIGFYFTVMALCCSCFTMLYITPYSGRKDKTLTKSLRCRSAQRRSTAMCKRIPFRLFEGKG